MATLGQAVRALEERLFVGREHELITFSEWLDESPAMPAVLAVAGPGGVGKSALLSAFRRHAEAAGRQVVAVNAHAAYASTRSLLAALGGGSIDLVAQRLNHAQAVVFLDSFDQMGGLSAYLRAEILPRLDAEVRVIIAGRQDLTRLWPREDVWHKLVRAMPLSGLSFDEAREYLARRGLASQSVVVEQVLTATGGIPLGLSLAADLILRLHLPSLDGTAEWHLVVRSLVERLHETEDQDVRELLESASVLREFDEATLVAVAGRRVDPIAFARLCGLSIVQATANGLTLHHYVRDLLADDLRWRDAERHGLLRRRAAAYYRERAGRARPPDRARLHCNRFFVSEQPSVRQALFADGTSRAIKVSVCGPADVDALHLVWRASSGVEAIPQTAQHKFLSAILECPRTSLLIARGQHDQVLGFSAVMPISAGSLAELRRDPIAASVVDVYARMSAPSPPTAADKPDLFLHLLVAVPTAPTGPTIAVLLRELFEVFAQGGVHLMISAGGNHQPSLEALGFRPVVPPWDDWATGGYVLDLSEDGFESWVDGLVSGAESERRMSPRDLERELQNVLAHWREDAWLRRSGMWEQPFMLQVAASRDATALRERVHRAITRLVTSADADEQMAYRALELAYLTPRLSHVAAAERMAVSRATLYRLIRRGVRGLAEAMRANLELVA